MAAEISGIIYDSGLSQVTASATTITNYAYDPSGTRVAMVTGGYAFIGGGNKGTADQIFYNLHAHDVSYNNYYSFIDQGATYNSAFDHLHEKAFFQSSGSCEAPTSGSWESGSVYPYSGSSDDLEYTTFWAKPVRVTDGDDVTIAIRHEVTGNFWQRVIFYGTETDL
tara:strand:+ start:54 stop:554 length:501 start_codon:yes stop_codon:yes gene_type:complete